MERKVGECYQWNAIGQCARGDSRSFCHDRASGNRCDQRQEGQPSSPAPKAQTQTDGKRPSRNYLKISKIVRVLTSNVFNG